MSTDNDDIVRVELSDLLGGADSDANDDEIPNWDRHQTIVNSMAASEGEGYAFLTNGMREKTTCDWDFQPISLPVQVKLEQDTEHEEVDIVSSAKGINETYLNLGDHLVDLVYVADNVMVIETHKKGKR